MQFVDFVFYSKIICYDWDFETQLFDCQWFPREKVKRWMDKTEGEFELRNQAVEKAKVGWKTYKKISVVKFNPEGKACWRRKRLLNERMFDCIRNSFREKGCKRVINGESARKAALRKRNLNGTPDGRAIDGQCRRPVAVNNRCSWHHLSAAQQCKWEHIWDGK